MEFSVGRMGRELHEDEMLERTAEGFPSFLRDMALGDGAGDADITADVREIEQFPDFILKDIAERQKDVTREIHTADSGLPAD